MTENSNLAQVPEACTLPTAELPLRQAEFDELFGTAVDIARLTDRHARLSLAGPAGLAEQVRDLAAREQECCSFFTFTIGTQPPDLVIFEVEVPAGHVAVLDALLDRAARVRAGR